MNDIYSRLHHFTYWNESICAINIWHPHAQSFHSPSLGSALTFGRLSQRPTIILKICDEWNIAVANVNWFRRPVRRPHCHWCCRRAGYKEEEKKKLETHGTETFFRSILSICEEEHHKCRPMWMGRTHNMRQCTQWPCYLICCVWCGFTRSFGQYQASLWFPLFHLHIYVETDSSKRM